MKQQRMGRPRETQYVLDKPISIRFSEQEWLLVRQEANREGITVGRWIRQTIRKELNND